MIRNIKILQGCPWSLEEIRDPKTGEITGKILNLINEDDNEVYQYPLAEASAKQLGQLLMGIGSVQVANGSVNLDEVARQTGKGKR